MINLSQRRGGGSVEDKRERERERGGRNGREEYGCKKKK